MPYYYDDNGNKVVIHLLKNILEIINRTTGFPIYEISSNFIANKIRAKMKSLKTHREREKLLFEFINDYNPKQCAEMKAVYNKLDKKEKQEYIDSAMDERIYMNQEPMKESEPIFFRLAKIYDKYDFLTPYDIYINKWGREIKTLNTAYVGEMYVI